MRRLVLLLALIGACVIMPSQYAPDVTHNPTLIPRVSDGDPPDASSVNPSIEALADMIAARGIRISVANVAALQANTTPLVQDELIFSTDYGIYRYTSAGGVFASDGVWFVDATGLGAGQYINLLWGLAQNGHVAALGTVPGTFYNAAANTIPYLSGGVARSKHTIVGGTLNRFELNASGIWFQSSTTTQGIVLAQLDVPHNSHLTSLTVLVQGGGGHGALPANKPTATLYEIDLSAGTSTAVSNASVDASGGVGAYDAYHSIVVNKQPDGVTALNKAIDNANKRYVLTIQGESGANSNVGFQVLGVTTICTVTEQDKG